MLDKAHILLEQGRYADAEKEIAKALVLDPEDDEAYGLLGRLKIDQGLPKEAFEPLTKALQVNPEEDFYIYLKAFAYYKLDNYDAAMLSLDEAIRQNPYNAGYFGLYAYCYIGVRQFADALEKANEGLALNAEDKFCLNARATALNKMGKVDEAIETMRDSLASDPDSDFTHVTVGWNYLEKGKHKKANEHFRESLRINPANNAARDGLKESLKSEIPPYRWLLMYGMWLHNQGRGAQIGITIGLYLAFRFVGGALASLPVPFNYIGILIIFLYLALVFCSWLINPIANFILSFHKEGKYAITNSERINGQTVVAAVSLALLFTIAYMLTMANKNLSGLFVMAAITAASVSLALSKINYPLQRGVRPTSEWIALTFTATGVAVLLLLAFAPAIGTALFSVHIIAVVIASWVNAFSRK